MGLNTEIIATFRYRHDGELARELLHGAGINSVLIADREAADTARPPVRVAVRTYDALRARELLGENEIMYGG